MSHVVFEPVIHKERTLAWQWEVLERFHHGDTEVLHVLATGRSVTEARARRRCNAAIKARKQQVAS